MKRLLLALGLGVIALALSPRVRRRAPRLRRTAQGAAPSYDAIALRAYFIGLEREARGEPSAPQRDWQEAEQQLVEKG